jgi:hypothetical protein
MVNTLPQYALESSIANNFGMGFEHGPQTTTIFTQIVARNGHHTPGVKGPTWNPIHTTHVLVECFVTDLPTIVDDITIARKSNAKPSSRITKETLPLSIYCRISQAPRRHHCFRLGTERGIGRSLFSAGFMRQP